MHPIKFSKGIGAEFSPFHLTHWPMSVEKVICSDHILVQAVGSVPGISDEAKYKVVFPQVPDLVYSVVSFPAGEHIQQSIMRNTPMMA